jgi:uncharacterized protein YciI
MLAAAVLLALFQAQAPASPAPAPAGSPDPTAFTVVSLRLGPKWDRTLPAPRQPGIADHGQYMTRLTTEGRLVLGGPFLEDPAARTVSGAMVIFATPDAAEARRLMEEDPGVKAGLLEIGEVRRFVAATGTWRPWHAPAR